MDARIVVVERAQTKTGGPMWRCQTEDGKNVNVFADDYGKDPFGKVGYGELSAMQIGEVLHWSNCPINVILVQNGQWYNLKAIEARPDGVSPDPELTSSINIPRLSAIQQAQYLMQIEGTDVVVWDSETTGLGDSDEIVSIAAVTLSGGEIVFDEGNIFICPMPPEKVDKAAHIHGITSEFLQGKPHFVNVYERLRNALHGKIWVAYNVSFDWRMLDLMCARYNCDPIVPAIVIDAMDIVTRYNSDWTTGRANASKIKLVDAAELLGVIVQDAHNALGDCVMTRLVIDSIARKTVT